MLFLVVVFLSILIGVSAATSVSVTTPVYQSKYGTLTYVDFETASGPSSSTPGTNTAQIPSGSSGSYRVVKGSTGYLWSPQFASATTISAGKWVFDFWASTISYVSITLTNSQSAATPNPLQEKMTWNPSTYASNEASNLGNIRFCLDNACLTQLNAWLESCTPSCSTSATSASAWVKLTSSIAANGGALTIYMVFLSLSTNFDNNFWGEAPNLSSAYGTNDNGANVFSFYDNFAGTALSAKWTRVTSGAGGTVTVNNGATFAAAATTDWVFVYSATQSQPKIAESYMVSASGDDPMLGEETSGLTNGFHAMYNGYSLDWFAGAPGQEEEFCPQSSAGAGTCTFQSVSTFPAGIWSLRWAAAGTEGSTDGAGNSITSTDNSVGAIANYGIYVGTSEIGTGNNVVRWSRMRAYPPSNVLPSTSFGSVSSTANALSISIFVTDSSGNVQATVASAVASPSIGAAETQISMTFSGSLVTVPANGYVEVSFAAASATDSIYWGVGQPTNFQVPFRVLS
ncbi:MAG TPA: hypothetical protein VGR56_06660 [Nitrososphaerales archaeon]|nr:hypothetical protein [Nitrososphaerales archaeon]